MKITATAKNREVRYRIGGCRTVYIVPARSRSRINVIQAIIGARQETISVMPRRYSHGESFSYS